jgi:hypothetical protein
LPWSRRAEPPAAGLCLGLQTGRGLPAFRRRSASPVPAPDPHSALASSTESVVERSDVREDVRVHDSAPFQRLRSVLARQRSTLRGVERCPNGWKVGGVRDPTPGRCRKVKINRARGRSRSVLTKAVGRRVGQHADRAPDGQNSGWSFRTWCFRNCFSLLSSATELAHKETRLCGNLADDLRGGAPRGAGSTGGEHGERQSRGDGTARGPGAPGSGRMRPTLVPRAPGGVPRDPPLLPIASGCGVEPAVVLTVPRRPRSYLRRSLFRRQAAVSSACSGSGS